MVEVGFRKKLIIQLILVYKRLKPILEVQQSKDQIGFRSSVGVDDAFAVFENVCSKSMEWSVPMWCASLDKLKGCTNCLDSVLDGLGQTPGRIIVGGVALEVCNLVMTCTPWAGGVLVGGKTAVYI